MWRLEAPIRLLIPGNSVGITMNTFILSRQKADLASNTILKQSRQYYLFLLVNS